MKVIYIAGPYRGANPWEVEQNVRRAEELAFEVARAGAMPLCPHTNTRHFNGTCTDAFWLEGTLELLRRCDGAIFTDDWQRSHGAREERGYCVRHGLPLFDAIAELERWLKGMQLQQEARA